MNKKIYIFRHGETDWNLQGRFQGHLDIPLNATGKAQAREVVSKFVNYSIEAILSSDLSRALETGKTVASILGIPIFQDSRLRESHFGEAEGLTREQVEIQFGSGLVDRCSSFRETDADIAFPGGETGNQVIVRAFEALQQFLIRNPYQRIGVATHGGVIRRVMQKLLPPNSPPVSIPNGIVYEIEFDGNLFHAS